MGRLLLKRSFLAGHSAVVLAATGLLCLSVSPQGCTCPLSKVLQAHYPLPAVIAQTSSAIFEFVVVPCVGLLPWQTATERDANMRRAFECCIQCSWHECYHSALLVIHVHVCSMKSDRVSQVCAPRQLTALCLHV